MEECRKWERGKEKRWKGEKGRTRKRRRWRGLSRGRERREDGREKSLLAYYLLYIVKVTHLTYLKLRSC